MKNQKDKKNTSRGFVYRRFFPEFRKISENFAFLMGFKYEDLFKSDRDRSIVLPRQVLMCIFRARYSSLNLKTIGAFFKKDHVTVMHALKTVANDLYTKDAEVMTYYFNCVEVAHKVPRVHYKITAKSFSKSKVKIVQEENELIRIAENMPQL